MMISIASICFCLLPFIASSFSTDWSSEFDHITYLDEDNLFRLYWNILADDVYDIGIEASATGWIALGISPRGQMPNSDIAIGWVDDIDGTAYLQDRYTEGRSVPLYDNEQSLTLIEGEQADGMTRLRFTRSKYSCDPNDLSIAQGTSRLIWAFHATDDPDSECFDSSSIGYHTNKGSQSINLDSGVPATVELESDVQSFDLLMDNYAVPATDTTYYCKLFALPVFTETQYAVKFEMVVQDGNEAAVHHMIAYTCPEYLVTDPAHVGTGGLCDELNMPSRECRGAAMAYAWAIGGNDLYLPKEAAMPLSGDSDFHYVLMEMHYDNPLERSDIVDSSGVRMYYTPTARQYDAGVLIFGISADLMGVFIPPGIEEAHNAAFISSECTEATFPDDGIKVFGSFLHQHTIGAVLKFRHIRDGKELAPLDTNLNYDFNYQQTIVFEEPLTLLPGDEFILDCYWNSSERTEYTEGGEAASQEMCFEFLFYYPKIDLTGHFVQKTSDALVAWLDDAEDAGYVSGWNGGENGLESLTWHSSEEGYKEFYNRLWSVDYPEYNKHVAVCNNAGDWVLNDTELVFNVPRVEDFEIYESEENLCDNQGGEAGEGECKEMEDSAYYGSVYFVNYMLLLVVLYFAL